MSELHSSEQVNQVGVVVNDYSTHDPDMWRPCGSHKPHPAHTHKGLSGYACLGVPKASPIRGAGAPPNNIPTEEDDDA